MFESHENMTVSATILCPAVRISDVMKRAGIYMWQRCKMCHRPTFLCISLVKMNLQGCIKEHIYYIQGLFFVHSPLSLISFMVSVDVKLHIYLLTKTYFF